jgi:tryptophanyl-tRNA synthetase
VGEDQVPHLEMTREVARRFNQMFCGVDEHAEDADHVKLGGAFPVPVADVGKVGRLVGTDGVKKMSKSLNNAIFITDDLKTIKKKMGQLFTGRQSMTEKGDVNNALFQYVRTFIPDESRVKELERKYAEGDNIGDGHIKAEVAESIDQLLAPMRERRKQYEGDDGAILTILRQGCERAIACTEQTLSLAKEAAKYGYFNREVRYV